MKYSKLNIDYYNNNAHIEARNQLAKSFTDIHHWWYKSVEGKKRILDIGCGVGRDSAYLAANKHEVVSVDPSDEMLEIAGTTFPALRGHLINDKLPTLECIDYGKFDIIICSSVFHLLPVESHIDALSRLKELLKPGGFIALSLKHSPKEAELSNYPIEYNILLNMTRIVGLKVDNFKPTHDHITKNQMFWSNFILTCV